MASDDDYILDLKSLPHRARPETAAKGPQGRKWLSITFRCCHTYGRIYLRPDGLSYRGFCPKCGKPVKALVGDGGTSRRFFVAE